MTETAIDDLLDEPGDGPRLRGLRHMLGYGRLAHFADDLDEPGLSADTLGDVERGTRGLSEDERKLITDFARVGEGWFSIPLRYFGMLLEAGETPDSRMDRIEAQQGAILAELRSIRVILESGEGPLARLFEATEAARESEGQRGGAAPTRRARRGKE